MNEIQSFIIRHFLVKGELVRTDLAPPRLESRKLLAEQKHHVVEIQKYGVKMRKSVSFRNVSFQELKAEFIQNFNQDCLIMQLLIA